MSGETVRIRKGTPDGDLFESDLANVEEHLDGRENDFIESVRNQWDNRNSVTQKQWDAVANFLDRIECDASESDLY